MRQEELHRYLIAGHKYAPLYGDRLANHLPMSTSALWRIGAGPEQIDRFAANYARRLELRTQSPDRASGPAQPKFHTEAFEQNLGYFNALIDSVGPTRTIARWLPRLVPGLAASAFHGLIRTAYAMESGCTAELAQALAFWAAEYTELPITPIIQDRSSREIVDELIAATSLEPDTPGIIIDRMKMIAKAPYFRRGIPTPRDLSIDVLRSAVLDLYGALEDFTLLHTVTATHALRVLEPHTDNMGAACRYLWVGVSLATATVAPRLSRVAGASAALPDDSWEDLLDICRNSLDDHAVKLAYTALRESTPGTEDVYRMLVARKLASIKPNDKQSSSLDDQQSN